MKNLLITACLLIIATPALAAPKVGEPAPDFKVQDIAGKEQSIGQYKGKTVVLEWHNPGCPFVKKFYESGTMQGLQGAAKEKGVVWLTINSGAKGEQGNMTQQEAQALVTEQKLASAAYIVDESGTVGRLYDAKTTPHMFVIDKAGALAYMGAIDSKPSTKAKDIPEATNYVTAALDALEQGRPVETASTAAYGCSVKYAD